MKKQIISALLVILVIFNCLACGTSENPEGNGDNSTNNIVTNTADYLVKNGQSDYKIVISNEAATLTMMGASEIAHFIRESSGAELPIIEDTNLTVTNGDKYISLGKTKVSDYYQFSCEQDKLGSKGYEIITKDKSILISGADQEVGFGNLYGAYEFLHHAIGYECYSETAIALDNSKDVALQDYKIWDKPDIEWRTANSGSTIYNSTLARRLRFEIDSDLWLQEYGQWHTSFNYINPNEYYETHPEWFSSDRKQLCYTANGDENELDAMQTIIADKMTKMIESSSGLSSFTFTHMDGMSWCTCKSCAESYSYYNANSAAVVKFCNTLVSKINANLERNNTTREYYLYFFVYTKCADAPVVVNSDGTYSPKDNSVICAKNVRPLICTNYQSRTYSLNDEKNSTAKLLFDKWKVLCDYTAGWTYSTPYDEYFVPYDIFTIMQDSYRFLKDKNVAYIFDLGQWDQLNGTGFYNLKSYLNAKLGWNVNSDVKKLTDGFFDTYFGIASKEMRNYYEDFLLHFATLRDNGYSVQDVKACITSDYYPFQTLKKWEGYINDALSIIEGLKLTDYENYVNVKNRINLEKVAVNYLLISLYESYYSPAELYLLKKETKQICIDNNVSNSGETADGIDKSVSSLWAKWGI